MSTLTRWALGVCCEISPAPSLTLDETKYHPRVGDRARTFRGLYLSFDGFAADLEAKARLLMKLDGEWSATAEKKDVESLASYYAEDAVAYPPNYLVAVGRLAVKGSLGALF